MYNVQHVLNLVVVDGLDDPENVTLQAVSYTHLDVYKRQAQDRRHNITKH